MGFFTKSFDFNHDGKLSPFERAARAATICAMMEDEKKRKQEEQDSLWDDEFEDEGEDSEDEW